MKSKQQQSNNHIEILVVEDSKTQAEQLRHFLEQQGFAVSVAGNGKSALKAIRTQRPTVIISDVVMPEMDGFEFCKTVKSNPEWREIPVILVTSLGHPRDVIKGLQAGADNFIRKPYDAKYLLTRVRYILANRDLRKSEKMQMGIELILGGEKHFIESSRQQILDLLISTFEEAVHMNGELKVSERKLARSYESLNGLYKIADGLNQSLSIGDVCEKALTRATALPSVRAGWIALRDGETGFRMGATLNLPPALEEPGVFDGDCLCRRKLLSGELDSATNIFECERLMQAQGDTRGLRVHATIPLWSANRTLGIMNLVGGDKGMFSEEDLQLLYAVGNQVGIALERASLLQGLERLVEERTAALTTEIAERRQTEEALRQAEEKYRGIFENAVVGIYQTTTEGRFLTANPTLAYIYGYKSPEELMASVTDLNRRFYIQPGRRSEFIHLVQDQGEVMNFESQVYKKDGSTTWITETGRPLRNPEGTLIGFEGTAIDITDRKHAEDRIREQAALLDITQDAILIRDLQDRILFWNKGAERLYGWTSEEVLNRDVTELLYRSGHRSEFEEAKRVILEKGIWFGELGQTIKDGKEVIVESHWTAIRDSEGRIRSILDVNTDITKKKILEGEFLRAQRLESIGTLAGGIAHDLNNVLGPILLSIDVMRRRVKDPGLERMIDTVELSAKRGADLVRQVLSFARGTEGERVSVQVRHLIHEVESIIKETFPKSIMLELRIRKDIPTVLGDATQIQQILMNLCVNARDAMPSGGTLTITGEVVVLDEQYVGMHPEAKAGRYVAIHVTDTGTGMPPDVQTRIFEPFFTTKEIGKGTGLGLSTVRTVVKSHGGFVTVYSELGKGTTFRVYLPAQGVQEQDETKEQQEIQTGKGECVLVVDDEEAVREITRTTLEAFGYSVVIASDGTDAIGKYAGQKDDIALVITDMMMPYMDGAATILALRKMNPNVKILAVSGLAQDGRIAQDQRHIGFLQKPYTSQKLLQSIRNLLDSE